MNNIPDKLNIILIAISAFLAYLFPLELFLITYAILGPLHYVTEINWLNDKNYYFNSKKWLWLSIGIISALILFAPRLYYEYGIRNNWIGESMVFISSWSNSVLFICLLLAIGNQFIISKRGWVIFSITGLVFVLFLNDLEFFHLLIGTFVPTIIHVYFFTLIFMVYGTIKSNSAFGYLAVFLTLLAPCLIFVIPLDPANYLFNDSFKAIFVANEFYRIPVSIAQFLGLSDGSSFFFYETLELRLMMFMSFIYCYHYLNWFSKTTVIKWHRMLNLKKSIGIGGIWLGSLFLYYIDFRLGFLVSLFLSFMHVILEFPLNMESIKGILVKLKPPKK